MHLSSLPSPYGIGNMGKAARDFADFLSLAGQKYWQLLPICPTGYGDSPYQSYSTNAGNPYFIDLDTLCEEGLLTKAEIEEHFWGDDEEKVDYGALYNGRYPVLKKAAARFWQNPDKEFYSFCEKNAFWLDDYALFMALKKNLGGAPWYNWEAPIRNREAAALDAAKEKYAEEVKFWKTVQYIFFKQWHSLLGYVNSKGIKVIGDLPIYVSLDGVDVWSNPELFQLDENKIPKEVAGCPPDGFSADGQLWGNPLYDWDYHEATGYKWWIKRIEYLCSVYDVLVI